MVTFWVMNPGYGPSATGRFQVGRLLGGWEDTRGAPRDRRSDPHSV